VPLLRFLFCFNTSGGTFTAGRGYAAVGLLVADQNFATATFNGPFNAEFADRAWLYVACFALSTAGTLIASGDNLWQDWKVRGGKGSTAMKDSQHFLAIQMVGMTGGTATATVLARQLMGAPRGAG